MDMAETRQIAAFGVLKKWLGLDTSPVDVAQRGTRHHRRRRPNSRSRTAAHHFEGVGDTSVRESLQQRGPILAARSWACQLQAKGEEELSDTGIAASQADCVVIDYSRDGSALRAFSAEDVARMKKRRSGLPKTLVAYMSIGEAECARSYWNKAWVKNGWKQSGAPVWLYRRNDGGWDDNWKVSFWHPEWQRLIIDNKNSFLNQIIDANFDGVFLDIVDAAEYWADEARGADRRANASNDMIALVARIADHARVTRGKSNFLVIPNGDLLLESSFYRSKISALMREDTIYMQAGKANNAPRVEKRRNTGDDGIDAIGARLKFAAGENLPVLAIEYLLDRPEDQGKISDAAAELKGLGSNVLPYFSVRDLDQLCPEYDGGSAVA
jgi:uncharacterized protein (TIGR01370 family)